MPAVARIGDTIGGGCSSNGGPDTSSQGSGNVYANGVPITRLGDATAGHPCGPPSTNAAGSPTVFVNNVAVTRVGDAIQPHGTCDDPAHSGLFIVGSPNVFADG